MTPLNESIININIVKLHGRNKLQKFAVNNQGLTISTTALLIVLAIQLIVLVSFYCRTTTVLGCGVHNRVMFYGNKNSAAKNQTNRPLNLYNFNTISQTTKISRSCGSAILSYWLYVCFIELQKPFQVKQLFRHCEETRQKRFHRT